MPARGHSSAPKFDSKVPRELPRYFAELEVLFQKCKINDDQEKKIWARHYTDIDTADTWSFLPECTDNTKSYNEFVQAVKRMYPGTSDTRRWTIADMDKLIGEQLRIGIHSISELSSFYLKFYKVTQFLVSKGSMATTEQSRAFMRAFQPTLVRRIMHRLEVKFPDKYQDDHYDLKDIYEAATFVLHGPTDSFSSASENQARTAPTVPEIKKEELADIFDRFASTLITALRPQQPPSSSHPLRRNPNSTDDTEQFLCHFCGGTSCSISTCPHVVTYIADGKVKRNSDGKVVLPNGTFVPRTISGRWLRERVDEWHRQNPDQRAKVTVLAGGKSQQLMLEVSNPRPTASTFHYEQRIEALEREILALRKKERFDGVEVPTRPSSRTGKETTPSGSAPSAPTISPPAPAPERLNARTNVQPRDTSNAAGEQPEQPPLHPFRNVKEAAYVPPHDKNFGSPATKPAKDREPAYRAQAPIQDSRLAEDVLNRAMSSKCITISLQELLAISPDARNKVREAVTPKRTVSNNAQPDRHVHFVDTGVLETIDIENVAESLDQDNGFIIPDPYEIYLNTLAPDEVPKRIVVARESHALRSVNLKVGKTSLVEAILDGGCQVVAMSEAVCHEVGVAYDPSIRLEMQSANGELDLSLGLARNIPCRLGDITLFLQMHVIRSPAYDILLGRPFDVLTASTIRNFTNEDQTITISDPNTGRMSTVPTFPRKRRKCASNSADEEQDVNFHKSRN